MPKATYFLCKFEVTKIIHFAQKGQGQILSKVQACSQGSLSFRLYDKFRTEKQFELTDINGKLEANQASRRAAESETAAKVSFAEFLVQNFRL